VDEINYTKQNDDEREKQTDERKNMPIQVSKHYKENPKPQLQVQT